MTGSEDEARKYSFKLLSYRGLSESELRARLLKKGFSEDVGRKTVDCLKQGGYINDVVLADNLKRHALTQKLLGYQAAKAYLIKKGIPVDIADSTLSFDEETETRNLRKLLDKRLGSMGNYLTEKEIKRLFNFLARRGYSLNLIKKALRDLKYDEESEI